jgi:hypothetical protein
MYQRPAGELPQATPPPTPPQTKYDVGAKTVPLAGQCFSPRNVPFLQWSKRGDGSFDGTLRMGAATVTTSQVRTSICTCTHYNIPRVRNYYNVCEHSFCVLQALCV